MIDGTNYITEKLMLSEEIENVVVINNLELTDKLFDFVHEIFHVLFESINTLGWNLGGEEFFWGFDFMIGGSFPGEVFFHFVDEL